LRPPVAVDPGALGVLQFVEVTAAVGYLQQEMPAGHGPLVGDGQVGAAAAADHGALTRLQLQLLPGGRAGHDLQNDSHVGPPPKRLAFAPTGSVTPIPGSNPGAG